MTKIAGNKNKVVEMTSTECDCGQEHQQSNVPVNSSGGPQPSLGV